MTGALTRRAALSGAVASVAIVGVGVAVAMPVAAVTDATVWDAALRDYRIAEAASDHHWRTVEEPASSGKAAYSPDQRAAINAESDVIGNDRDAAEDRLFEVPAPHMAALAIKLNLLFANDRDPIPGFQRLVLADATRLAKMEG